MTRSTARWGRLLAVGALLVTAAQLLTACGSDDDDEAAETVAAEPGSDDAGDTGDDTRDAFPVTIEHQYGETTVEEAPERVVTVGLVEQDALLALGVVPVATTEWFGEHPGSIFPWATDRLEELGGEVPATLGDSTALNTEAVAAQEPDLIVAIYTAITADQYETLSQIAPVLAPPEGVAEYGAPWQDLTVTVGRAIGKGEEAEALVADVEAHVESVVDEHPELEGASGVMATPYEGVFVYGPDDVRGRMLTSLGFELPADLEQATGDAFGGNLAEEHAELLDVDAIVWLDPDDGDGPLGGPLYEQFAVHTEGREVFLDSYDSTLGAATSVVTVLSIPYLVDGLAPMLAAAVDGDPATEVPTATG